MKIPNFKSKILIISALASSLLVSPVVLTAQGEHEFLYLASLKHGESRVSGNFTPRLNEIPALAARHLAKNYQRANEITWARKSSGFVASIQQDGYVLQVNYDQAGNFQYAVRFVQLRDLGGDICRQISKLYPGFSADIVAEVKSDFRTEYILTIKNESSMKSLMVRDGQIQVIDDLSYAAR